MSALVEVRVEGGGWETLGEPDLLAESAVRAALEEAGVEPEGYEVSLLLTDDAEIAVLNGRFRGRDRPTNVLSWPTFEPAARSPGERPAAPPAPEPAPLSLGDVALAGETVRKEASETGLAFRDHAAHLIVHGALHLLGYDHEREEDALLMEAVERRALARLGVADPYG